MYLYMYIHSRFRLIHLHLLKPHLLLRLSVLF